MSSLKDTIVQAGFTAKRFGRPIPDSADIYVAALGADPDSCEPHRPPAPAPVSAVVWEDVYSDPDNLAHVLERVLPDDFRHTVQNSANRLSA